MSAIEFITCMVCHSKAPIIEDPRYDGMRGICLTCDNNWPES
ncbi:MAG: hypothetical protein OEM79_05850 [Nitrosopumilus sp.]|nr:hypothetical protein [Nitrosopumilus sp.]